jgi:hypothetical protein
MAVLLKTWPKVEVSDSIQSLPAKRFTWAEIHRYRVEKTYSKMAKNWHLQGNNTHTETKT